MTGLKKESSQQYNPNWGGAREGGGRPKKGRSRVVVMMDADVIEWLDKQEKNRSDFIDELIRGLMKKADE